MTDAIERLPEILEPLSSPVQLHRHHIRNASTTAAPIPPLEPLLNRASSPCHAASTPSSSPRLAAAAVPSSSPHNAASPPRRPTVSSAVLFFPLPHCFLAPALHPLLPLASLLPGPGATQPSAARLAASPSSSSPRLAASPPRRRVARRTPFVHLTARRRLAAVSTATSFLWRCAGAATDNWSDARDWDMNGPLPPPSLLVLIAT